MRRHALRLLLVAVAISAALGVYALLAGDLGWFEVRVLLTALTVSGFSILAMACGAAWERGVLQPVPSVGVGLGILAGVMLLLGIWTELESEGFWKAASTVSVVAAAAAHASLLTLARLAPSHRWMFAVAYIVIGVFSLLMILAIVGEAFDDLARAIGVSAVLLSAVTIAVPIVHRMDRDPSATSSPAGSGRTAEHCPGCGAALGAIHDACSGCGARFDVRFFDDAR